ncbi:MULTISPECIES: hypothetical protein [unclassified Mesorhizobium]|uniref:hypothetical protein n=1 Tax=unclassified Mesorhizobium TaxID=325217 RepID=UPI00333C46ED
MEAYRGRGQGDLIASRDAEDILLLVDGREEIVEEIANGEPEIRAYIAEQVTMLLADPNFDHFLEGNIRGPVGRTDIVYDPAGRDQHAGSGYALTIPDCRLSDTQNG